MLDVTIPGGKRLFAGRFPFVFPALCHALLIAEVTSAPARIAGISARDAGEPNTTVGSSTARQAKRRCQPRAFVETSNLFAVTTYIALSPTTS
jgi:hypothetical protein